MYGQDKTVGILTFISRSNFMFSWFEHGKKFFYNLGPGLYVVVGGTAVVVSLCRWNEFTNCLKLKENITLVRSHCMTIQTNIHV